MDKRALFALLVAGAVLLLVLLLVRGPKFTPAPAPPSAPEGPLALRPAMITPEPTLAPGALAPTPVPHTPVVMDPTTAKRELDLYTGGIAYLAPVEDQGTRYALMQTKEVYGLQLMAAGEQFGPETYVQAIEPDRLIMEHGGQEKAMPRRYKPYDAKGTYFDPDTKIDPAEYQQKLEEYKKNVLPTLGRPAIIMRELERIRASERYRIDGGSGPGPDAKLSFASKRQDVWYSFGEIAHAWGVVVDVSRPVDGKCEIAAGDYTLPEVMAAVDHQCPTKSRVAGRSVYVEYLPRTLSSKQGGVVVDPRLRDKIDRFYSPNSPVEFLLPELAKQLKMHLDLSPQVRGKVRLDQRNTTGLEILEEMLPQVGAAYYIKGATLYVEPAAPPGAGQ